MNGFSDGSGRRTLLALLALLGWAALAVQSFFMIKSRIAAGYSSLEALVYLLAFYTIPTNALCSAILTVHIPRRRPAGACGRFLRSPAVLTTAAASIVIVGLVFNLLLRDLWHPQGLNAAADAVLHIVMPLGFVPLLWLARPQAAPAWAVLPLTCIYPLGYFGYILLRGRWVGLYPYPFFDVSALGYGPVLLNAAILLAVYTAVAAAMVAVLRRWKR
jgi:hypothetical protein